MPPRPVFLDYHATTPVDPRVRDAMLPFLGDQFGNASSVNHAYGWAAHDAVEKAREQVAALINAPSSRDVVFTSGATESNNLAILGVLRRRGMRGHVITTAADHAAVLDPVRFLQRNGVAVTILAVDEHARVSAEQVAEAIRPETALVSVIWANNQVGSLNPIAGIAAVCGARGVWLHVDASQAAGRIPMDVQSAGVDLLSLSGHKCHAPQGVGALYIRPELPGRPAPAMEPLQFGGGHERRIRSGTVSTPLAVSLGAAAELAKINLDEDAIRIRALRDRLQSALLDRIPDLVLNGHPTDRLAGNLNVSVPGVNGETLMSSMKEIAVSSGSACSTADPEPSHVLIAMGRSRPLAQASIRFGLGRFTKEAEVDFAAEYVPGVVARLRSGG
jgi:cysteine desulfurase